MLGETPASAALKAGIGPGSLYIAKVMHQRVRPKRHRFVYRVFTLLLDIDRLADLHRSLRLLGVEKANLFSFRQRDHGPKNGAPLRPWVEQRLKDARLDHAPAKILLLAMPRFLGYVFNPLSVYYCFDTDDRLYAVVHEVKNTFGEQHAYALPAVLAGDRAGTIRQRTDKRFYVSPFIEAKATYHFRLTPPGEHMSVAIREEVDGKALLFASISGERQPLTDAKLLKAAITHPFVTQKVITGIHLEALWLWLKGIRLQPYFSTPDADETAISNRPRSV